MRKPLSTAIVLCMLATTMMVGLAQEAQGISPTESGDAERGHPSARTVCYVNGDLGTTPETHHYLYYDAGGRFALTGPDHKQEVAYDCTGGTTSTPDHKASAVWETAGETSDAFGWKGVMLAYLFEKGLPETSSIHPELGKLEAYQGTPETTATDRFGAALRLGGEDIVAHSDPAFYGRPDGYLWEGFNAGHTPLTFWFWLRPHAREQMGIFHGDNNAEASPDGDGGTLDLHMTTAGELTLRAWNGRSQQWCEVTSAPLVPDEWHFVALHIQAVGSGPPAYCGLGVDDHWSSDQGDSNQYNSPPGPLYLGYSDTIPDGDHTDADITHLVIANGDLRETPFLTRMAKQDQAELREPQSQNDSSGDWWDSRFPQRQAVVASSQASLSGFPYLVNGSYGFTLDENPEPQPKDAPGADSKGIPVMRRVHLDTHPIRPGGNLTVSVEMENLDENHIRTSIALWLGGQVLDTQQLALAPGGKEVVSLWGTAPREPGTYELRLDLGSSEALSQAVIVEPVDGFSKPAPLPSILALPVLLGSAVLLGRSTR